MDTIESTKLTYEPPMLSKAIMLAKITAIKPISGVVDGAP